MKTSAVRLSSAGKMPFLEIDGRPTDAAAYMTYFRRMPAMKILRQPDIRCIPYALILRTCPSMLPPASPLARPVFSMWRECRIFRILTVMWSRCCGRAPTPVFFRVFIFRCPAGGWNVIPKRRFRRPPLPAERRCIPSGSGRTERRCCSSLSRAQSQCPMRITSLAIRYRAVTHRSGFILICGAVITPMRCRIFKRICVGSIRGGDGGGPA